MSVESERYAAWLKQKPVKVVAGVYNELLFKTVPTLSSDTIF